MTPIHNFFPKKSTQEKAADKHYHENYLGQEIRAYCEDYFSMESDPPSQLASDQYERTKRYLTTNTQRLITCLNCTKNLQPYTLYLLLEQACYQKTPQLVRQMLDIPHYTNKRVADFLFHSYYAWSNKQLLPLFFDLIEGNPRKPILLNMVVRTANESHLIGKSDWNLLQYYCQKCAPHLESDVLILMTNAYNAALAQN